MHQQADLLHLKLEVFRRSHGTELGFTYTSVKGTSVLANKSSTTNCTGIYFLRLVPEATNSQ